jgi:hypothetical protein
MRLIRLIAMLLIATSVQAAESWPEIKWESLIPKSWDPTSQFKGLNLANLKDSDPRAIEALALLKQTWENAPAEASLNGQRVRIAGFALPLERQDDKVTEFLLVPYFGACIHVPPPPSNQIIHAKSAKPLTGVKLMTPVWTYGTLNVQRAQTQWGAAAYQLTVDKVMPYEMSKQERKRR